MPTVLAIDPGSTRSGWVIFDGKLRKCGLVGNLKLRNLLRYGGYDEGTRAQLRVLPVAKRSDYQTWLMSCGRDEKFTLAVEMIASYGMPVGASVFETCVWIGRFVEAWGGDFQYVTRRAVKLELCNSAKAKDSNVSQALRDRFGWSRSEARKLGLKADIWQALGVAVCWWETMRDYDRASESRG